MIYTTYFAKLKKLPSHIVPVSISQYPPEGYSGLEYKNLAPDKTILLDYKRDGDWNKYVKRYGTYLKQLNPAIVMQDLFLLTGSNDIALVCFEKDHTHCHRSIVAAWLNHWGYNTEEYKG